MQTKGPGVGLFDAGSLGEGDGDSLELEGWVGGFMV